MSLNKMTNKEIHRLAVQVATRHRYRLHESADAFQFQCEYGLLPYEEEQLAINEIIKQGKLEHVIAWVWTFEKR